MKPSLTPASLWRHAREKRPQELVRAVPRMEETREERWVGLMKRIVGVGMGYFRVDTARASSAGMGAVGLSDVSK